MSQIVLTHYKKEKIPTNCKRNLSIDFYCKLADSAETHLPFANFQTVNKSFLN